MRSSILSALMALAALVGAVSPVASAPGDQVQDAPSAAIHMQAQAGFDGLARPGGWAPVNVDLANEGSELKAEVQIVVQQPGGRTTYAQVPTTFTLPVVLPRMSHKRFTMDVNLPPTSGKLTARLVNSPGGELITEQDLSVNRVPLGEYFCGVLARDPSSYDFLGALDLPPPIRRVRTAPLDPDTFPDQVQVLGSFDCLILDNAATARLSPDQLDALQLWVAGGGLLIEVGGATWQSTLVPLPPSLLPIDLTGLTTLDSLSPLGDLLQQPFDVAGPWLVSQSKPRPDRGGRVIVAQNGIPLMVASRSGDGTILYLAFEPTARPLRSWAGNEALWRYFIGHASMDSGIGSSVVRPYVRWGRIPRLGLADFSGQPKPTLSWLWVLMAAFGVALSGVLIGLRRSGRIGLSIVSVLGMSVVAGGAAFAFAQQHAEPDLAVTRLSVVHPTGAGSDSVAYTHEYVAVLARRDGTYNVSLSSGALARGMFYPFPRPTDESDTNWAFRVSQGATEALDQLSLKQGQLATASVDGQIRQAPGVQSDLRIEGGDLTGTIVNHTGGRLADAFVVIDNQFQSLGSIEKEQQRQLDVALPKQAAAGNTAATSIADKLIGPSNGGQSGAVARRDLVESLFSARQANGRLDIHGPTLVGWLEQSPSPIQVPGFRVSSSDYTLLIQPLQAQLPRGFDGEVPASAMGRRDLGVGNSTPTDRDYYSIGPGEAVTLAFSMPPSEGRFQLDQLRVNVEGSTTSRLAPRDYIVSLYNWQAAEWQSWDVGPGASILPDGGRFVSASGEVRLRYSLDASANPQVREVRLTRLDVTPVGAVR